MLRCRLCRRACAATTCPCPFPCLQLRAAGVGVLLVGLGEAAKGRRFAELLQFPPELADCLYAGGRAGWALGAGRWRMRCTTALARWETPPWILNRRQLDRAPPCTCLPADPTGDLYRALGFSPGFLPDTNISAYAKLLPMLAGIGSPGTIQVGWGRGARPGRAFVGGGGWRPSVGTRAGASAALPPCRRPPTAHRLASRCLLSSPCCRRCCGGMWATAVPNLCFQGTATCLMVRRPACACAVCLPPRGALSCAPRRCPLRQQ